MSVFFLKRGVFSMKKSAFFAKKGVSFVQKSVEKGSFSIQGTVMGPTLDIQVGGLGFNLDGH